MNKENAKDYLPLVQALAEGKTIQRKLNNQGGWINVSDINTLSFDPASYRIKPEPKKAWYRNVLLTEGVFAATCPEQELSFSRRIGFIRWLTDRIEYELPEVEGN